MDTNICYGVYHLPEFEIDVPYPRTPSGTAIHILCPEGFEGDLILDCDHGRVSLIQSNCKEGNTCFIR